MQCEKSVVQFGPKKNQPRIHDKLGSKPIHPLPRAVFDLMKIRRARNGLFNRIIAAFVKGVTF